MTVSRKVLAGFAGKEMKSVMMVVLIASKLIIFQMPSGYSDYCKIGCGY